MTTLIPKFDLKNGGTTPVGAINRAINQKLQDFINAKDFGVVADGVTDDTTALQNALNYAGTNANILILPTGTMLVSSALTVSFVANANGLAGGIQGQGQTSSVIKYTGSSNITVLTITANYAETLTITGFKVLNGGSSTGSTGIQITKVYGSSFFNVASVSFSTGFYLKDTNSNKYTKITAQLNVIGLYAELGGGQSYPNLNDFDSCNFLNNSKQGVFINNGTNNTFKSCNFAQNGGSDPNSTSIYMYQEYGGNGGGFSLVENCYFEDNLGKDFWASCNGAGAYNFINNSFNKINGANNVTNHIYLDASALSSATNLENLLCMMGNTFAKLNGYTGTNEDVLLIYGINGFTNFVVFDQNVYESNAEAPTTYNLPAIALNNDRSGTTTNKKSTLYFLGKDSTGVAKDGANIQSISNDINWVNAYLQFVVRNADALMNAGSIQNTGAWMPYQAPTASAPTYIKGGMYFDTTLNKLRIGGATGWETVTSA